MKLIDRERESILGLQTMFCLRPLSTTLKINYTQNFQENTATINYYWFEHKPLL